MMEFAAGDARTIEGRQHRMAQWPPPWEIPRQQTPKRAGFRRSALTFQRLEPLPSREQSLVELETLSGRPEEGI